MIETLQSWVTQWSFWSTLATVAGVVLLKFNDFRHLGMKVDKIEERLDSIEKSCAMHKQRTAKIEGKISR